jgi:hypothetical protein
MKYKCPPYYTGKLRIGEMYDYPIKPPAMRTEEYQLQSALMRWDKEERRERRVLRVCVAILMVALFLLIKE